MCAAIILTAGPLSASVDFTEPTIGISPHYNTAPRVAFNGSSFLTLWTTSRGPGDGGDVRGFLADASGANIGTESFLVLRNAVVENVAPFGSRFLALWRDGLRQPYLSFISQTGIVERTIEVSLPPHNGDSQIAVNGNHILVATLRANDRNEPFATIITADGAEIQPSLDLGTQGTYSGLAAVGNGEGFAVAVSDGSTVTLRQFSTAGRLLRSLRVGGSSNQFLQSIEVASDGQRTLVAWTEPGHAYPLRWSLVDTSGEVVGTGSDYAIGVTAALWTGKSFCVVASSLLPRTLLLLVSPSDGDVERRVESPADVMAVTNSGDILYGVAENYLLPVPGAYEIIATVFNTGTPGGYLGSSVLSISGRRQWKAAIAGNGVDFAAAWVEQSANEQKIRFGRLSGAGSPLDGKGIDVAQTSPFDPTELVIAHGGSAYLIAWTTGQSLAIRRIDENGSWIDPEPVGIRSGPRIVSPAVSWNGENFLLAWRDFNSLAVALIGERGGVAQQPLVLTLAGDEYALQPRLAWDGKRFLLVWSAFQAGPSVCGECPPFPLGARAIRISRDGHPLDENALSLSTFSDSAAVASSGSEFLVVTSEVVSNAYDVRLDAILVGGDGPQLLARPAVPIATSAGPVGFDVTWDGLAYVVAREYFQRLGASDSGLRSWIAISHVTRGGSVIDETFTQARVTDYAFSRPALASNGPGKTVAAVSEFSSEAGAARLRGYFDSELRPMPRPPAAAPDVHVQGNEMSASIRWRADEQTEWLLIERYDEVRGVWNDPIVVRAGQNPIRLRGYDVTRGIRAYALNAAGISDPSAIAMPEPPWRRRAVLR